LFPLSLLRLCASTCLALPNLSYRVSVMVSPSVRNHTRVGELQCQRISASQINPGPRATPLTIVLLQLYNGSLSYTQTPPHLLRRRLLLSVVPMAPPLLDLRGGHGVRVRLIERHTHMRPVVRVPCRAHKQRGAVRGGRGQGTSLRGPAEGYNRLNEHRQMPWVRIMTCFWKRVSSAIERSKS
jgi:hypothetical protein